MPMPMAWRGLALAGLAFVAALALVIWAFGDAEVRVTLEDAAKPPFAALCGAIGVMIDSGQVRPRYYQIRQGQLSTAATLPRAPGEARGLDPLGARKLIGNTVESWSVEGPYLQSPDGVLIAAATEYRWRRGFAIVEVKAKRVVTHVQRDEWTYVKGFAWAPNSQHLATLENTLTSQFRRPQHWLSAIMGHPVQYHRPTLEIHTASGQRSARSSLSTGEIRGGADEVVWFNGCPPSG